MSRNSGNSGKVSGKVRFIMLEADITDGNLSEITQAIAGAVRPTTIVHQVIAPAAPSPAIEARNGQGNNQAGPEMLDAEDVADVQATLVKPKKRSDATRQHHQPKPMNGINWEGVEVPFSEFIKTKNPKSNLHKFLAITAWFKLYYDTPSVSLDHIYNGYRQMGWGWDTSKDMGQNFREGVRTSRGWYEGDNKGVYAITDIGITVVNRMSGSEQSNSES